MSDEIYRELTSMGGNSPSDQKFAFVGNDDPEQQKLAEEVQRNIASSGGPVNTYRGAARDDFRYYYGHQWPDLDKMRMEQLRRPALTFNEIQDKIDAISGIERLNRQDVRFVSRSLDTDLVHDASGDLATEAVSTVLDMSDGEYEASRTYKDAEIAGMGWAEVRMDYTEQLDGLVLFEYRDWKEMRWDPKSKKDNLADAQWLGREKMYSRRDFKKRWPDMQGKVDQAAPYYQEDEVKKYELVTPFYSLSNERANPEINSSPTAIKDIPVIQYQWRDSVPVYRIADKQNAEQLQTLSEEQWGALKVKQKLAGLPMPNAVRQLKSVYKQVYVAMGVVLEEPTVLPQGFSLLCITGQWDGEKKVWYGIVRGLKDPQNTMNKAMSALVTQYISNVKGGVIYKTGTFSDPNMAKIQWSAPDAWIEANPEADLTSDIKERTPATMSQAPPMLFQESKASMSRISGVSDEMLGIATNESTAPTIGKRVQGGLAILGWFWDNIARFRKQQAKVILEFVREYWSHGQLIRVGGNFNSQSIPLLKSGLPMDYDLVLDDSVRHNPNLRAQVWQDLMSIAGPLLKIPAGMQIMMKGLKFSPFPAQLVAEIQEAVQNAPPAPPKGRGKDEPQELVQAKTQKISADAQKALAQARKLDRDSSLKVGELVIDAVHKGADMAHKKQVARQKVLQDRIAAARNTMQNIQQPQIG